jgi:phage N-6-adenine-methyltransferase
MTSNFYTAGSAAMTSNKEDWGTPQELFDRLDAEYHFTLDAASTDENAKCLRHYTPEHSGLEADWRGETVFLNPPYGRDTPKWVAKAAHEALKPHTQVVMLLPARTDTRWFHDYLYRRARITFLKGRLKFTGGGGAIAVSPVPQHDLRARMAVTQQS